MTMVPAYGQLPEAMRSLAEKNIAQTRELYERPCLHAGLYLSR